MNVLRLSGSRAAVFVAACLVFGLAVETVAARQLPHNIPDLCAGSADSIPPGQTVTLSGVLVKDCLGVPPTSTVILADGLNLKVTNFQVQGRIIAGSPSQPATNIRIQIRDIAPTDFDQWGTSLLMFGPINLVGQSTMTWTRLAADAAAGSTSVQLADVSGVSVGGQLVFGDERHLIDSHENDPRVTQYVSITSIAGNTVNFAEPLQISHKGARSVSSGVLRYPPVGYVTRSIVIESENPNGTRGHVAWTGGASGLIKGVRFRNLGRTPNDVASTLPAGRYGGCHFHMNTGAVTFTGNVVEAPLKWGCTVHGVTGQALTDNVFVGAKGWGWGTENGQEHDNLIARNLTINTTGDGNRGDRGRDRFDHPIEIGTAGVGGWAARTKDIIRDNVDVGALIACFMLWGDRATPIREFSGNECWGSRAGLTMWDVNGGTVRDLFATNTWLGLFNYATKGITYENMTAVGDPSAIPASCFQSTGPDFGDYSAMESRIVGGRFENLCEGIRAPWAIADVFPGTETTPRTFIIEDASFANNRTDIGFHTGTSSTTEIKPVHTTIVRRTHHAPSSSIWIANTGPVQVGDPDPVFVVDDFQGVAGDDVTVYSADYAPPSAGTRAKFLDRVSSGTPPPPPQGAVIAINPSVKHQVFRRWEGAATGGPGDYSALTPAQLSALQDLAVEVGVNSARLAVRSGAENPAGTGASYDIVNDNGDPNVINPAGFVWDFTDALIDRVIVPMRQKWAAKGGRFYVNLNYVDFGASTFEHYQDPAEYAEFMLAFWQHCQAKYGFVPDAIEPILEPNDVNGWNPDTIGRVIVATAQRLQAAGFAVPDFVAPSTSNMGSAAGYIDGILAVPGAAALVKEFSYHRYGGDLADLAAIGQRAATANVGGAMLEKWDGGGATYRMLVQDLTTGRGSAWQQGQIADNYGCQYGQVAGLVNGTPTLCPNTRLTAHYTRHIKPGAQRIGASGTAIFDPVAFINPDGSYVVVVKAEGGSGPFSVTGLQAGTYKQYWTYQGGSQPTTQLPDVTIASGQALQTQIDGEGAITIYGSPGGPPPPPPIDCQVSAWSEWSAWTPVSGDPAHEQRTRTRTITQQPANGGAACPPLTETELRDAQPPSTDDDGDGVPNAIDKCPGTSPGVKVDANGCALPPSDPCVVDPLRVTRIAWPTSNTGRRSITFDVGNKRWVSQSFTWPGTLTVTDDRGCTATVRR